MSDNKELELFAKQQDPGSYVRNLPEMQGLEEWQVQEVIERLKRRFAEAAAAQDGSMNSAELEKQVIAQNINQIVGEVRANFVKNEGAAAADGTPLDALVVNEAMDEEQRKNLMSKFKNYALPIGFPGGVRSQVKSAAQKAVFSFSDQDSAVFTRNEKDKKLLQVTINGDCDKNIYVDIGNKCSIGIAYNKETGEIDIISDFVFYQGDDGQYKAISLQKKGGWFRKKEDELSDVLGRDTAKEVRKSVKNLKIIACSNPNRREDVNEADQPKRCAAALMRGKSKGVGSIFGLVGMMCAGAAAMVLSGFGIAIGVGMLIGAGSLTAAAVTGASAGAVTGASAGAGTSIAATGALGNSASTIAGSGITSAGNSIKAGSSVAVGATTGAALVAGTALASTASTQGAAAGSAAASGVGGATASVHSGLVVAGNGIVMGGKAGGALVLNGATTGALSVSNATTGAYQQVASSGATQTFLSGVKNAVTTVGNTFKNWGGFNNPVAAVSGAATQSGNAISNTAMNTPGALSGASGQVASGFQTGANATVNGVQGLPGQDWNAVSGYGGALSGAAGQSGSAITGAASQTGNALSGAASQMGNASTNIYNSTGAGTVNQIAGGVTHGGNVAAAGVAGNAQANTASSGLANAINPAISGTKDAASTVASGTVGAAGTVAGVVKTGSGGVCIG